MSTISLAMIVKNEEAVIARVLACARHFCDEMIIVDTGSTDRTIEFATGCGAQVHRFEWTDDFSAARNYAFSLCSCEWIIWLDADDVITNENIKQIIELKNNLPNNKDVIYFTYNIRHDENGRCVFANERERLMRRSSGLRWRGRIHESIPHVFGQDLRMPEIIVEHRPKHTGHLQRNLEIEKLAHDAGDKSNHAIFHYGQDLITAQQYERAIEILEQYNMNAQLSWMHYWTAIRLGHCHLQQQKPGIAKQWYLRATCMFPARAEAWCALGRMHYDRKEWIFAIPYYSAAVHLMRPDDVGFCLESCYTWEPRDFLAVCCFNAGDYAAAYRWGSDAIVLENNCERVRQNLAKYAKAANVTISDSPFKLCAMPLVPAWGGR